MDTQINKAIEHIEDARKGYSLYTNNQLGMADIYGDIAHSYEKAIDILTNLKKSVNKLKKQYTMGNNSSNNSSNSNNTRKRKRKRNNNA